MKRFAILLLTIYLILAGLMALGVSFPYLNLIVGVIAIVAGVLFLLVRK
jgi:hypothetical protein